MLYSTCQNVAVCSIELEDCFEEDLRELFEIKSSGHIAFCHIYEMVETFKILLLGGYRLPTKLKMGGEILAV